MRMAKAACAISESITVPGYSFKIHLTYSSMKSPIHPTPIMLQQVADDGMRRIGFPVKIFDRAAQGTLEIILGLDLELMLT